MTDNQIVRLRDFQDKYRLTGEEVAIELGISRSLLIKLYSGQRNVSSKLSTKIDEFISRYPSYMAWVASKNPESPYVKTLNLLGESTESYINPKGNKFENKGGVIVIEVPFLNFDDFSALLGMQYYLEETLLERKLTFIVDKIDSDFHVAFKVTGSSMFNGNLNDTPDSSVALCKEVPRDTWHDGGLNSCKYGFVILAKQNIFFKDIVAVDRSAGVIICHSRNTSPEYSDFEVFLNEVHAIFKVVKRTF